MERLKLKIRRAIKYFRYIDRNVTECLWAHRFHDFLASISWTNIKSLKLKPGRWAVGYNFMFVALRILDTYEPNSFLEFGLGESSKLFEEYIKNYKKDAKHVIVEHDKEWVEAFQKKYELSKNATIHWIELDANERTGRFKYRKDRLKQCIKDQKFEMIVIDGPWGSERFGMKSRDDIVEFIPQCLEKDFIIILDDYDRMGEKRTVREIVKKLERHGIGYCVGKYEGECDVFIIASSSRKLCATL